MSQCIFKRVLISDEKIHRGGFGTYRIVLDNFGDEYYVYISRGFTKSYFEVYLGKFCEYTNRTPILKETYGLYAWKQVKSKCKEQEEKHWEEIRQRNLEIEQNAKNYFCK